MKSIEELKNNCKDCDFFSNARPCNELRKEWAEAEYAEEEYAEQPEVDWSKIPIDTKIYVKNSENDDWKERHFSAFKNGKVFAYLNGKTSFTSIVSEEWRFAKLAELQGE